MIPATPPRAELPTSIGPYRVIRKLGRGGMGVVYEAVHPKREGSVALKTVRLPSERHLSAIRREIRALAQVRHPGVVRIVDEGVHEDGLPWYAMELLGGVTLREHQFHRSSSAPQDVLHPFTTSDDPPVRPAPTMPGPVQPEHLIEVLSLFRRLCDPLGFVHGEGLVHCDLKPENVFLCDDGRAVLVDFGLISRFGGSVNREVLDLELFVGTAEYMAPEQWEGKPVDARTDLYALGCILFETLTGQPPFVGPRKELYKEHLKAPPPRARILAAAVPKTLDDLLQALLSKAPGQRPGHADEVARVLEDLGARVPEAGPPPRPYLFRPALAGRGRATNDVIQRASTDADGARVVLLAGESGVGKTRLAMEAARMAKRRGLRVLTGECLPNARLLRPLTNLMTAVADRCHRNPEEVSVLLGPHARLLARLEPTLLHIPAVKALPAPEPLPAEAERARLLEALIRTLGAFARKERLFWVLDDLQWADGLTLDFLEYVLQRRGELAHVAILATYRGEEIRPELESVIGHPDADRIALGRLNGRAVARMVADMLGMEPPEGFVQFLTAQSEGNPFFVAEYLRTALGAGLLERTAQGQWTLAGGATAPDQMGLPRSLAALLAHRLDHLSPHARQLADAGAVLGRELDPDLGVLVAALSEGDADAAIAELLRKQIIEETGSGRVRFSHDKIREVAYATLQAGLRADLHRRSARELDKAKAAGSLEVTSAALAHHWIAADEPAKAVGHLDAAAEEALSTGGYEEATRHLEQALELSQDKPDGPVVALAPLKRAGWHQRLGETYLASGKLESSNAHSEAALDLLGIARPTTRGAWTRTLLSQFMRQVAHRLLPERLFVDSEGTDALAEATRATAHMARIAFFENDPLRIIASSVWSINLAERAGHYVHAARNYSGLGWTFGLARLHRVADAYFARARRVGEATKDWAGLIFCLTSEAVYRIGRGEFAIAEEALASSKEACDQAQDPQSRDLVETLKGHPPFFRGQFAEAVAFHRSVLDSARDHRHQQHTAWSLYCIGRSQLALGLYDEAQSNLQEARAALEGLTDQMSDITCAGLLASAQLRGGQVELARKTAEQTQRLIGKTLPTAFITCHGYEGIAEVAVHAVAHGGDRDAQRHAKRAVKRLLATASVFVVAEPRARLLQGRLLRLLGHPRRASRALQRGLDAAQRLGQRYEEACLLEELGRLAEVGSAERLRLETAAHAQFRALDCVRPEGVYLDP